MPNAAGAAGAGGLTALALLLPMEAGVPIPLPADLVMFTVGQQVGAHRLPLWLAVAGFEAIAIVGTTALFLVSRGPAHQLIARFGPRPARPAHPHRHCRGCLRPGRPPGAARARPGQQRVPPGSPGPWPAPRPACEPGLRPGQASGASRSSRPGRGRRDLLADPPSARRPGRPDRSGRPDRPGKPGRLAGSHLSGLHRRHPARRPPPRLRGPDRSYEAWRSRSWQRRARSTSSRPSTSRRCSAAGGSVWARYSSVAATVSGDSTLTR